MLKNDESPLADTEVHYFDSANVGDEFKIFVGHCGDTAGAAPPVVLYVTDANGFFGSAVDTIRLMQLSAHLPPILVVGIGYRLGGLGETEAIRVRDFTPTYDPAFAKIFPDHSMMGGADNFLAFLRDELGPWVRANYRVAGDDSVLFGHSLGGLFATHVLLTQPRAFRRYIVGSPSYWWGNDMIFGSEETYAQTHDDLPAQVFFTIGEHEDHDGRQREASRLPEAERAIPNMRYIDMVADTARMVTALRNRNYPSLDLESVVLADELHVTVAPLNLSRGLRHLFDAPR